LQAQQGGRGGGLRLDESTLWTQYELLQIYDRLSLYLCLPPQAQADLGPVPTGAGGELVTLALRPGGGDEVVVAPWPFREGWLVVGVAGRLGPLRDYAEDDFRQALAAAEAVTLTYKLRAG